VSVAAIALGRSEGVAAARASPASPPAGSPGHLDALLVETLRTIAGVTRTHTTIVLSSVKETTRVQVDASLRTPGAKS